MGEESLDLHSAERAWMLTLVKPDEPPDPVDVGLFGAEGVVPRTDLLSRYVE
jgi:hypothetical protein